MGFPMWKVRKNRGTSSSDKRKAVGLIPQLFGSPFISMKEAQSILDEVKPFIELGKFYNSIGLCSRASIYALYVLETLSESDNPFIKSLVEEATKEGLLSEIV